MNWTTVGRIHERLCAMRAQLIAVGTSPGEATHSAIIAMVESGAGPNAELKEAISLLLKENSK